MNNKNIKNIGVRFSSTNQPPNRGRKKKFFSYVLDKAKNGEIEEISNEQFLDIYRTMISLNEDTLKKIVNDKKTLMIERIIAKEILGKKGFDIIEKILNRICGMPRQQTDLTTKGEKITNEPIIIEVIDKTEDIKK